MSGSGADTGLNPKLPTWNLDWRTFPGYKFAALLELDGCKEDERPLLAPRLVRNLTGRAWECCLEVDRNQLKTPTGVEFLLEHLRAKRGKQQVDLLGDALEKILSTR